MGAKELQEWARFWRTEPWGAHRDNVHTGILASLIVNALRKKGSKAVSYQDFMLVDRDEHRKQETQRTINWLKSVAKPKKKKNGSK
jgi:hypothetical protein